MADDQKTLCLIADVVIDQNIPIVLSYEVPSHLCNIIEVGCRCQIPFRQKTAKGFVMALRNEVSAKPLKTLQAISNAQKLSPELLTLSLWMSKYYVTPLPRVLQYFIPKLVKAGSIEPSLTHAIIDISYAQDIYLHLSSVYHRKKKAKAFIDDMIKIPIPLSLPVIKKELGKIIYEDFLSKNWLILSKKSSHLDFEPVIGIKKILTQEQLIASSSLNHALNHNRNSIHLVYGVCGSGKTEVYFEAIQEALRLQLGVIYMVPEVSLAPQTIMRLKKRFQVPMAIIHHQISDGVKKQDYENLHAGTITFVVGARSCIFAPVKNLGLIIIDEEHESAYKQEGMPTYNAKDVAIMRARLENAMVILGSATPSIDTFYRAQSGKIILHTLKSRPGVANLPQIHLSPLGTDFQKAQGLNLFSEAPYKALFNHFKRGEQTLIFINRRGYHAMMQCSSCGEAIKCDRCSIAMTFHKNDQKLICHFCGFQKLPVSNCPLCGHETMKFKGIGTQLVEAKLQSILKEARILRIDKDTTSKKGSLDKYFEQFSSQGADILIGTQMIAKGLDFPNLTLAIILNIDGAFNRPDFRAHEQAYQLMTQVAGRTGRSYLKGEVYIQTFNPEHPLCLKAQNGNYELFYEEEIKERQLYNFPPFSRLVRFVFSSKDEAKLLSYANEFRSNLSRHLSSDFLIEPLIACFHEVIDHHHRHHFLIKGSKAVKLYEIIDDIDKKLKLPSIIKRLIDVDPVSTYY